MKSLADAMGSFQVVYIGSTLNFRGTSLDTLSDLLFKTMEHCLRRGEMQEPIVAPPWVEANSDRVKIAHAVNIDAFFSIAEHDPDQDWRISNRSWRLSNRSSTGSWTTTTTGEGLEQSVFENAILRMTQDEGLFRQVGRYKAPVFPPIEDRELDLQWRTTGFLIATYIVHFKTPPLPISPFFLLAAFAGAAVFEKLTLDDIVAFDPERGRLLKPWYDMHPELPKPAQVTIEFTMMLAALDFHVSPPLQCQDVAHTYHYRVPAQTGQQPRGSSNGSALSSRRPSSVSTLR